MKEELYIYTNDGERKSVDLNTPSGITLKLVSNLFNSLDKVNCSYSYTFTIPYTRHNREVFDNAEDIRHSSNILGTKIKCEYIQNGIPLFNNSYLYLEKSTVKGYSCVMTWNVIDGLQKLKDDGCSLNELRDALVKAGYSSDELEDEGMVSGSLVSPMLVTSAVSPASFYNELKILTPYYNAGVPFGRREYGYNGDTNYYGEYNFFNSCYPLPVMPTKYLFKTIEKAFGISLNIGKSKAGEDDLRSMDDDAKIFSSDNIVSFGCVPLVKDDMTDKQIKNFTLGFDAITNTKIDMIVSKKVLGQENVLKFKKYFDSPNGDYSSSSDKNYLNFAYLKTDKETDFDSNIIGSTVSNVARTGFVLAGFCSNYSCTVEIKLKVIQTSARYDWSDEEKCTRLIIWSYKNGDSRGKNREYDEVATLKPVYVYTHYKKDGTFDYDELIFNTIKTDGFEPLSIGEEQLGMQKYYFFKFSKEVKSIAEFNGMTVTPKINDSKYISHYMDTFTNLPDIDCLTFVKSVLYMMGEYPVISKDGVIKGESYNKLKENMNAGYVYNWSSHILSNVEFPEEVKYRIGDFKQNNYYMTKWDDLDRTPEELDDEEDIYEDGILNVNVGDFNLDKEQTVFQIPFYPPYILNRKNPYTSTGNTIKAWNADMSNIDDPIEILNDDGSFSTENPSNIVSKCEAKPAYGILHCKPFYNTDGTVQKDEKGNIIRMMRMKILNPFVGNNNISGYSYLQRIVSHPFVITEKLRLSDLELKDIDFSRPVFLDKYNSYFAIITIQRSSNGICKCELVKLPTE